MKNFDPADYDICDEHAQAFKRGTDCPVCKPTTANIRLELDVLINKVDVNTAIRLADLCVDLLDRLEELKYRHSILRDIHDDNNTGYRERIEDEIDEFILEEQSHS